MFSFYFFGNTSVERKSLFVIDFIIIFFLRKWINHNILEKRETRTTRLEDDKRQMEENLYKK